MLAEAEQLTIEGVALLLEVIEAMKDPPVKPSTPKALLSTESASSLLAKAREAFVAAKEKAPDPALIDETFSKLGRVIDIAAKHSESIKPHLK